MIACSRDIAVEKSLNFSDDELSYVIVYSPNLNIFLGSVYLKPECNYKNAIQALQDIRNFVVEGPEDAKVIIYGDWNLNCLEYKREIDSEVLEPYVKNPMFITIEDNAEISKAAAERAIATKLISIADELDWQQIFELPTFRKHQSDEKSHLDRIFCKLNTRGKVQHTETNKTRHDVIEFNAIIKAKPQKKKNRKLSS